jgi:hypothetical protein
MKFKIRYCDRKDPKHPFKIFDVEANNEDEALKEFLQIHPEAGFWQTYPESDFHLLVEAIDSDRRTFETGAMRGSAEGKENYIGAISWTAIKRVTEYQNNAEKKGGYNKGHWKKGIPIEEYEKSLMRHLQKYFANKYEGASYETDVDHLAAAYFNLQGILHEEEKKGSANN